MGILVLLAWRIPANLIIFLTALAIVDDLGAVLIIAVFYTQHLNLLALGAATGILVLLIILNQGGIRHPLPYGLLGIVLWITLLKSGIHATVSGCCSLSPFRHGRHSLSNILSSAWSSCKVCFIPRSQPGTDVNMP